MPLILGTNSIKDTGYEVANSVRFDDGSSDSFNRTPSSAGSTRLATFSFWLKRGHFGITPYVYMVSDGSNNQFGMHIDSNDKLVCFHYNGSSYDFSLTSTSQFRDPSAWYHFVIKIDTANGTAIERLKLFVNGVYDPWNTTISQNFDGIWLKNSTAYIGSSTTPHAHYDGYFAEYVVIDGTALEPTSFGEYNEDSPTIWQPIDVSGLTFGTNGFYLDFEDSSALGNDAAGSNNFTVNNLTAVDQSTDTCTNNFATLNPVVRSNNITFAEGNLKITGDGSANFSGSHGTIAVNSGKWYCEVKVTNAANLQIGALIVNSSSSGDATGTGSGGMYYYYENIYWQDNNTQIKVFNTSESGGNASVTGGSNSVNTYSTDIISMALDMDNGRIYFAKNGTYENSGNPANGTNAFVLPTNYNDGNGMTFYAGLHEAAVEMNFGSPSFSISSGNADGNGYGNFEYAVPSGYYALNTKNLAEFG